MTDKEIQKIIEDKFGDKQFTFDELWTTVDAALVPVLQN